MTSVGLKKRPQLEDLIGKGVSIRPKVSPWTKLGDDPRVLAYRHMDPAVYRDLELKIAASRRFRDVVRFAAMRDGISVGHMMAASGMGGGGVVPNDIVGDHDAGIEKSIAMDEIARRQVIERERARVEDIRRQADEELKHPNSKSAAERARDVGYDVGTTVANLAFRPGQAVPEYLVKLAGYMAANTAEDATVLASKIATMISDARDAARRHEEKMIHNEIPTHLGRQEA